MLDLEAIGLIASKARPRLPGGPQTIPELVRMAAERFGPREALVGRGGRYTYAALADAAERAAGALASLGVRPGDRVAASLPNDCDVVVAFLGAMRLGAVWVGMNRALAGPEKSFMLADAGARVFLGDPAMVDQVRGDARGGPIRHVSCAGPDGSRGEWERLFRESAPPGRDFDVDPFAPAAIAYTSGTTGFPKGAVHSQHNLLLPGAVAASGGGLGTLRYGVCLPLTLLNLMILGPLLVMQSGACCIAMDRIDPVGIADWIREERIVSFASVPAILRGLLEHPDVKPADLATLTRPGVGGASCPEEFRTLFEKRFGHAVGVGYGLTEAPTSVTRTPEGGAPPGTAGVALPQIELQIQDPDGHAVRDGVEGEICVGPARSGPWAGVYTPMLGYWNRADASAETLRGGWLHTGDLGRLDALGNLTISGRRSELILRGGANVYPAEVERVLHEDRRVAACAVLGVPDDRLGQRVVAAVQLVPGENATAGDLQAHCAERLARYKVPERVVFLDELPTTPMGKVRKQDLFSRFEA